MTISNAVDVAGLDEETKEEETGGAGVVLNRLKYHYRITPSRWKQTANRATIWIELSTAIHQDSHAAEDTSGAG